MSELRKDSDDFDKFILHSEFGKVLELAGTVKDHKRHLTTLARSHQQGLSAPAPPSLPLRSRKKLKPGLDEPSAGPPSLPQAAGSAGGRSSFDSAAELIRATLVPSTEEGSDSTGTMSRGECLVTDSLIDETIKSLADELKLCLDLKKQLRNARESQGTGARQANCAGANVKTEGSSSRGRCANPVATKFSKWQTDILTDWMIEHREHPFPTQDEIQALAMATHLSDTQVVNWTTNVRKRNLKATVEGGKKPHHFLDYLFLATDREKKMRRHHAGMDFSFLDNLNSSRFGQPSLQDQKLKDVASQPPAHTYTAPPQMQQYSGQYQPSAHPSQAMVAPPPVPSNASQIFRGKRGVSPPRSFKPPSQFTQNERERPLSDFATSQLAQRERERAVLQHYQAPHDTPPGAFEGEPLDAKVSDAFEEAGVATSFPNSLNPCDDGQQSKAVSFEMSEAPFDESAEDYLMKLMSS